MTNQWASVPLSEVVSLRRGHDLPESQRRAGKIPVVGSGSRWGWHDEAVEPGPGVVIGRATNLGVPHWIDGPYWPLNTTLYVDDFRSNEPRYIYHLFQVLDLGGYNSGSVQPMLNRNYIAKVPVFLPPLDEQRRIAEVLVALDDLIDTNEQLKAKLDELARAVFLRAWDGETWTTIGELGEVTMGQSPPGDTYSERPVGMPFHQGVRDFGARFPRSRVYCSAPTRVAQSGDILIAVRAPVGEMNVAPQRLAIGRGLAALRATRPSSALQAIRAFESTWSAHQGTGTVFSSINGKDLRAAKVPLVDAERVESALSDLDRGYAALEAEGNELRLTRDELLPLLMSGAVRVRAEVVAA